MNTPVLIYHYCALKGAVKLEKKGLRRRGRSAKAIAIEELDLPKNSTHDQVIEALQKKIESIVSFEDLETPKD